MSSSTQPASRVAASSPVTDGIFCDELSEVSATRIDGKGNLALALPQGLSLGTFAGRFVCVASGFKLVLGVSRIRIFAGPTVGEREAKCPGRTYRSKEHEGDTNVYAVIRLHAEVSVVHLGPSSY